LSSGWPSRLTRLEPTTTKPIGVAASARTDAASGKLWTSHVRPSVVTHDFAAPEPSPTATATSSPAAIARGAPASSSITT